jgi:predicted nuclease of restriction endonuclease-like (RecB) superfamily
MLNFYWELGADIVEKQPTAKWGDGFLKQLSSDLMAEFPDIHGFSISNLKYIKQWYLFYNHRDTISQQPVGQIKRQNFAEIMKQLAVQIPWGHNLVIISKCKKREEALFYLQKTMQNNWSRSVLTHQIESGLFNREGKAITNFQSTLPSPHSDLAQQTLKDPYKFDFLRLREEHDEKELEDALINHVTRFLLELGAGFSFIGRQYRIEIEGDEFFMDLLFYHVRLHCYVVVELKTVKFKPEFAGKLNFYVSAVDGTIKSDKDNPTIGILICKSKKNTVVEYALKDIHKPLGVSGYKISQNLPEELKSSLPSIEEIEAELGTTEIQKIQRKKPS